MPPVPVHSSPDPDKLGLDQGASRLRNSVSRIIFGTDTRAGRLFDIALLLLILLSVFTVVLESVPHIGQANRRVFLALEAGFTLIFTIEYFLRLWSSPSARSYVFSFWGLIDLIALLPTYLSFVLVGYQYVLVVRILRLLRVFRIMRVVRFSHEASRMMNALLSSVPKISVFMLAVLFLVTILGTIMYVVEGSEHGFDSIPKGIYWAIVTVTTVGYGDLTPQTPIGQLISSVAMILGYAIIAVPTGMVSAEIVLQSKSSTCTHCGKANPSDARFCNGCGAQIKV